MIRLAEGRGVVAGAFRADFVDMSLISENGLRRMRVVVENAENRVIKTRQLGPRARQLKFMHDSQKVVVGGHATNSWSAA
jgi:hypothetical protein